jgi:2-keto-3-deoxy-L-rhamnonate aldolase RhmA
LQLWGWWEMMQDASQGRAQEVLLRLAAGTPCFSLGIRTARNIDIVRMAAAQAYDVIWIDLEHSTIPLDSVSQMCATARDLGVSPWVRVPEGDYGIIGRILDGGAQGIIVPHVQSAAEAHKAAEACRYPPAGDRSQNAFTVEFGYRRIPTDQRIKTSNTSTILKVLLESPEAIAEAEAIAAVPGVDILGLGLNDLSAGMGITGDITNARIFDACGTVIEAARKHGKQVIIGGLAGPDHYRDLVGIGMAPYIFAGIDTEMIVDVLAQRVEKWRLGAQQTMQKTA